MTTVTRTLGRGPATSDQRRQLILLAVLGVVLALLLVWQLPKILGGSSKATATTISAVASAPAQASAVAQASSAAAQAAATAEAPAPTGVQTGSPSATSSPAAARTEVWIKHQPARDPFVPLAGNEPAAPSTTPAATPATPAPTTAPEATSATPVQPTEPVTVVPVPRMVPTGAVLVTNGHRQVIDLHEEFTLGGTTFELVSVTPKQITIAVTDASFAGGGQKITLDRAKPVSLENAATGVRYSVVFRSAADETPTTTAVGTPTTSEVAP